MLVEKAPNRLSELSNLLKTRSDSHLQCLRDPSNTVKKRQNRSNLVFILICKQFSTNSHIQYQKLKLSDASWVVRTRLLTLDHPMAYNMEVAKSRFKCTQKAREDLASASIIVFFPSCDAPKTLTCMNRRKYTQSHTYTHAHTHTNAHTQTYVWFQQLAARIITRIPDHSNRLVPT